MSFFVTDIMLTKNALQITKYFSLILLGLSLWVMPLSKAYAANDGFYSTETTPEERAVFAYFKSIGNAPDYDYWISSHPRFSSLSAYKQQEYLIQENLRLGRGYGDFNLDRNVLNIIVDVVVKYIPAKNEREQPHLIFEFMNIGYGSVPSFDFSYGPEQIISLVINNLSIFADMKLAPEQDAAVKQKLPYEGDYFDARLNIRVRIPPIDSKDAERNIVTTRNVLQRIMYGEIAYLECLSNAYGSSGIRLWDYVAPWYAETLKEERAPAKEKYPHPYDLFKD